MDATRNGDPSDGRQSRFAITWEAREEEWRDVAAIVARHEPGSFYDRMTAESDLLGGQVCFDAGDGVLTPYAVSDALRARLRIPRGVRQPRHDRLSATASSICYGALIPSFAFQMAFTALLFEETPKAIDLRGGYQDPESNFEIVAVRVNGEVVLGSREDFADGSAIVVSQSDFLRALRRLAREFAAQVRDRVPELLEWATGSWLIDILGDRWSLDSPRLFPPEFSAEERRRHVDEITAQNRI